MGAVLRGAIAGCGFFGQIHLDGWRRIPEADIVAACDTDLVRAASSAPNAYSDLEQMLDAVKPDFLDIATRPELHLSMLRSAADRGIPVICQKPMAPTWQECIEMVRIAERAGIPFLIHENWRWQPWYRIVKEKISNGSLGTPVTYTFRVRKRDGAGPEPYRTQPYFREMPRLLLYETLVHHIDTARFLYGNIGSLFARLRRVNPVIQGEDQVLLVASHENGLNGIIDGNRFLDLAPESPPLGDAQFEFENGAMRVAANGDVRLHAAGREEGLIWKNNVTVGYRGDSVRATSQHFVRALTKNEKLETSGRDYLLTVAAVEAGYRSCSEGSPIRVFDAAEIAKLLE